MAKNEQPIVLPRIQIARIGVTLIGDSPLICHRWSEKAVKMMLDAQMKKARQAKEAKNPEEDFRSSLYPHPDGGYGFPAVAFKAAPVSACRFADGVKMSEVRGCFHIETDLVPIVGTPTMRQDMVRVGMGAADIRFRGEFREWRTMLPIKFNASAISAEQIINLLNLGGFGVGIGEWRPERDGSFGRFHVASGEEVGQ